MGMGQTIDINEFIRQAERAIANGVATLDSAAKIPKNQISLTASDVGAIATETDPTVAAFTKGLTSNNTILTALNAASGTISASVLPSYVDDFLEFATLANFPATGETGKIYLAQNTNLSYRWTGSVYVDISSAGTADAALRLNTPRTISTTGDAVYSVSFDGSADVSGTITLAVVNSNVGSFGSETTTPVITVDATGRITAISTVSISATAPSWSVITGKPTTLSGFGITDALPLSGGSLTGALTSNSPISTTNTTPSTSPTTGAVVVVGGQGVSGDHHCGGFSSFGGVASGHPAYKIKEVTGTTTATQGTATTINHGIPLGKIRGLIGSVEYSGEGNIVSPGYTRDPGYQFDLSSSNNVVSLILSLSNSSQILSKPFRILIFYVN